VTTGSLDWDGTTTAGAVAGDGRYTIDVAANTTPIAASSP